MGRHGAERAPSNDTFMATVVGVLLLFLVFVCLAAVF
jgi:hypothetical protein